MLEIDGQRSKIVELPYRWTLVDAPDVQYSIVLPGFTLHAPPSVLETWKSEFNVLIAEDPMMIFAMPPQLIGQASRFAVLEGLIEQALSRSNVWTGRCDEISEPCAPRLLARTAWGTRGACPTVSLFTPLARRMAGAGRPRP
jgi:peptidoglycan-N-acetylglucosamine deacetylase